MDNQKKRIAVLFDLDGTLWDAADTIAPAWNDWCRAHGIERRFTAEEFRGWCGKTMPDIAAAAFPQADPAWREAVIDGCSEAECIPLARDGGRLYPGLEAVLEQLHREHFLAVVSNCGLGYIESVNLTELFQILESAHLLRELLTETDIPRSHSHERGINLVLLVLD